MFSVHKIQCKPKQLSGSVLAAAAPRFHYGTEIQFSIQAAPYPWLPLGPLPGAAAPRSVPCGGSCGSWGQRDTQRLVRVCEGKLNRWLAFDGLQSAVWCGRSQRSMSALRISFITGNAKKLAEVASMLKGTKLEGVLVNQPIDLPELQGYPPPPPAHHGHLL
jgi:hypothetical protein